MRFVERRGIFSTGWSGIWILCQFPLSRSQSHGTLKGSERRGSAALSDAVSASGRFPDISPDCSASGSQATCAACWPFWWGRVWSENPCDGSASVRRDEKAELWARRFAPRSNRYPSRVVHAYLLLLFFLGFVWPQLHSFNENDDNISRVLHTSFVIWSFNSCTDEKRHSSLILSMNSTFIWIW